MTEAKGAVPAGFREETVEIGLISADKVQITSGNLKEGDEVYVQPKVTDSGMMMMNGRAAEGGGDSGAENAEGGGQQSGGDQGGGENGQS